MKSTNKKRFSLPTYVDNLNVRLDENYKVKVARVRISEWAWRIVRFVLLVGLSFIMLYPLLYMLSMTFRPIPQVLDPTVIWIPRSLTMDNLIYVMERMDYVTAVWMTIYLSLGSALILVVVCGITGYGFARYNFPFKNLLFAFLLFTIIIPPQTFIIPMFLMNTRFDYFWIGGLIIRGINRVAGTEFAYATNILGTAWVFYIPAIFGAGIRSGLLIYIYRQFFSNMPRELEEAAYIDGAGPLRTFISVMVPNAKPAIVTVFLFSIVWYWNDYFYAGTMLMRVHSTVSVRLSTLGALLMGGDMAQFDPIAFSVYLQAGSFLTILPPLLLYLVFQRHFTESIERSGIVG